MVKEIKSAYLQLAKKLHPDANPNDPKANEKFIKLQEAFTTLSAKKTKIQYDEAFK